MNQNQDKNSIKSVLDKLSIYNQLNFSGFTGSEKAYFVFRLYQNLKIPIVIILPTAKEAEKFSSDLQFFANHSEINQIYFPPYPIISGKFLFYHNETTKKRISALYQLLEHNLPPAVITTADAVMQKIIPKDELRNYLELIITGEEISRESLIRKLNSSGYVRAMIVEEPGEFSVRGGIIDIFSPQYDEPLRIEMLDDLVESIRFFSASTQRTLKNIDEATILPASEAILNMAQIDTFLGRIRQQASLQGISVKKVREIIEQIRKEEIFQGIESFIGLLYPSLGTFFDYIGENAIFVQMEPKELENKSAEIELKAINNFHNASGEEKICVNPEISYLKWSEVKETLSRRKCINIKMLPASTDICYDGHGAAEYNFLIEDNTEISKALKSNHDNRENEKLLSPLVDWICDKKEKGLLSVMLCSTISQADRVKSLLKPYGITLCDSKAIPEIDRNKGFLYICIGQLSSGFIWQDESLAIITEDEIFGAKHHRKKLSRQSIRTALLDLDDIKKDDLIVHVDHGIGQYKGLAKLRLNGVTNDFLLVMYKDDDKLYLPVDRMNMVQKYVGVEGVLPSLDKMGGKSWEKAKEKAKKSVEMIAGELLELYATRKIREGHSFGEVDSYYRDFEAAFPYEETPDQLRAIEEVVHDLQSVTPMDRLICGDVGYGKTEVALRASFVAVNEGKQVAILVPTTILAEQHFATFTSRFERYPFVIECLNRFRSSSKQRLITDNLKAGKVDIVIGTHRLLQKDIAFKDLGLVIIDEEQRFGVKHKEQLKKLRATVDVLALTATPIPRTLHMSLMGVRDISVIKTPPEQRHSIVTYITEFDDAIIKDAIKKELSRNGQIYFVHNNVSNIWSIAEHLQKIVPEVRLDVANGQMDANDLEKVMLKFVKKEIDMLVCTTIIESGLDIPSANTIIINRADKFGLAQIYQLRGRVGRASEQAYAYLLVPNENIITRDAQKRLKVLMEHSDLGSGFQIAMNDLRIRGGGSILSASQSGHIAAVGYDMFLQLMEKAMSELKGEVVNETLEPEINLPMSAFIPETYVSDIDQRLLFYRRLARLQEIKEIADIKGELIDRYGEMPVEASNLMLKIMLRILAIKAGIGKIDLNGNQLLLYMSQEHQKNPFEILKMISSEPEKFEVKPDHLKIKLLPAINNHGLIAQAKNILKDISQRVNG